MGQTQTIYNSAWLVLLQLACSSELANARWATIGDESSSVENGTREIYVHRDGTNTEVVEEWIRIVKDGARTSMGVRSIYYSPSAASVKILTAETINGTTTTAVDSDQIEDKPVASAEEGFDSTNKIMIAYPNVQVGSMVHLKYERRTAQVAIPGFYSGTHYFGRGQYIKASRLTVRSELPLFMKANNPGRNLSIVQRALNGQHTLTVTQKQPLHLSAVDEPMDALSYDQIPWVLYSTLSNWSDLTKLAMPRYEAALSEILPAVFEKIVAEAKLKNTAIDQINAVTSRLADAVRYVGDWRTVEGGFYPRSLGTIARLRTADCKDFSTATVAMLRAMGIDANVAWVYRGRIPDRQSHALPGVHQFNHAIVLAHVDSKDYWVDPTNRASFAQGIFEDIVGRPAQVLSLSSPGLRQIPDSAFTDSTTEHTEEVTHISPLESRVVAQVVFKGRSTTMFAGLTRDIPEESIQNIFLESIARQKRITRKSTEPLHLSSRIARDLRFSLNVHLTGRETRSSAGEAVSVQTPGAVDAFLRIRPDNRVSDAFLGQPESRSDIQRYIGAQLIGHLDLSCSLDSEWFSAKRSIVESSSGLEVSDQVIKKVAFISTSDIKSREFETFQDALRNCFGEVALVVEYKNRQLASHPDQNNTPPGKWR